MSRKGNGTSTESPTEFTSRAQNSSARDSEDDPQRSSEQTQPLTHGADVGRSDSVDDALRLERDKLRAVIDLTDVGFGVTDPNGTTLSLNAAALRMHGFASEAEMFARLDRYIDAFELHYPDGRTIPLEAWPTSRAMRGDYVRNMEVMLVRRDNSEPRFVSYSVAPVCKANHEVAFHVFAMVDLTERKQAEEAVQKAHEELETRVSERTEELRTTIGQLQISRKMAEAAVRESDRRFWAIADNAVDGFLLADPETKRLSAANQTICDMLGYSREEVDQLTVPEIHPQEHRSRVVNEFEQIARGEQTLVRNIPVRRKNGSVFHADINGFPIALAGRSYLVGVFRDLTESRLAHAALVVSERKYRALAESTDDIPYALDTQGRITYIGPQITRYGFDPEEILHRRFRQFLLPNDREAVTSDFEHTMATGEEFPTEFRFLGKNGSIHWFEDRGGIQRNGDGEIAGIAGVLRDITERKKLEKALAESADQERYRLGQELHDEIGPEMSAIAMMLSTLQAGLASDSPHARLAAKLEQTVKSVRAHLRTLATGLCPVAVDASGLRVALENLAEETARAYGIECVFECQELVPVEDNFIATQLFLVAREAVHNAVKHGRPQRIVVELRRSNGISLTVCDDGTGISKKIERAPHTGVGMGLQIMRHRAGLINGTLLLESLETGGTLVTCVLHNGR